MAANYAAGIIPRAEEPSRRNSRSQSSQIKPKARTSATPRVDGWSSSPPSRPALHFEEHVGPDRDQDEDAQGDQSGNDFQDPRLPEHLFGPFLLGLFEEGKFFVDGQRGRRFGSELQEFPGIGLAGKSGREFGEDLGGGILKGRLV